MTYVVTHSALSYPSDPATLDALLEAVNLPDDERESVTRKAFSDGKMTTVQPGEPVADLPDSSVVWLLEQGYIVPVTQVAYHVTAGAE